MAGVFLGDFKPDDKILVLLNTGEYLFTGFDLSTHFDERMIHLERFDEDKPVSVVYYEGEKDEWYVKRFLLNSARTRRDSLETTNNPNSGSRPPCTIPMCAFATTVGSNTRETAKTTSSTCAASFP